CHDGETPPPFGREPPTPIPSRQPPGSPAQGRRANATRAKQKSPTHRSPSARRRATGRKSTRLWTRWAIKAADRIRGHRSAPKGKRSTQRPPLSGRLLSSSVSPYFRFSDE